MILIRNLNQINHQLPKIALTIGNFDGVHLAHQNIINKTKEIAKKHQIKSALLSFEPHPIVFLNRHLDNYQSNFNLSSLAQKLRLLQKFYLDYVIILPFNQSLSQNSAVEFIERILIDKINTKSLVVGYDFTFGNKRDGNLKTLESYNFDLHQIAPIKIFTQNNDEITISSTLARNYFKNGKIKELNKILGYNFAIDGRVVNGQKIARQLGFKTANIKPKTPIITPKYGVYKTQTIINNYDKKFLSITNFGLKPTLSEGKELIPIFENHIIDFNQDIYHQKITIEFIDFIREEKKFSSIEELKKQIIIDINNIKNTNY